jgi:UDP-N-acetylglucosamine acyltransferase
MPEIHPTSIVEDTVQMADDVVVGPFCTLTGDITLGAGVKLLARVSMSGPVTVGENTIFYPNVCIGFEPQDYKFKPGAITAGVTIGSNCLFREGATVHASSNDHTPTRVGDRTFFMVCAHAGHDTTIGNDVILVNNVAIGGHAEVHDRAILSGGTMVHQFGRIGRQSMTSGCTTLSNDLPPFFMAVLRNQVVGLNLVGMRRSGMPRHEIDAVKRAYNEVFRKNPPTNELRAMLEERGRTSEAVKILSDFVNTSKRPICTLGGRRVFKAVDETV